MSKLLNAKFASKFFCGTCLVALGMPAFAQTAPANGLEEIVVTAQKREQNLQDVPIAISALSADKLQKLNVRDSRDLSGLAPNVTVVQSTTSLSAAVVSIRGITSPASESFGLDQANALYVDGIYIGRSGASGLEVMDLERVEILRGPQGTLFGRNSTGGAISFVSRDPSAEAHFSGKVGVGNYGARNVKFSAEPGEILGIRTSFSYAHSERNGVVDNILQPDSSKDPGARRSDSFRFAAKANLGSTGSIRYIYDRAVNKGRPNAFQLTNVADGTPRAPLVVDGQPGITQTQQAPVAQYLAAAQFLDPGCAALAVPTRAFRDQICLNADQEAKDKIEGHNLQIQNDFGGVKVKSTTGYRTWDSITLGSDLDGMGTFRGPLFSNATLFNGMPLSLLNYIPSIPAAAKSIVAGSPVPTTTQGLYDTNNNRDHKQFSQEIEISGDSNTMDWVVGGFFFSERGGENNPQNSGFVYDTNAIFLANFGALGPSFVAANPARYRLVVTNGLLRYRVTSESKALYGQATYYVGGRDGKLSLTGGLRYTWDDKSITRWQSGATAPATPDLGQASFKKLTWNAMARYELSDEASVYVRAASGYRSGGFNAPDTTQAGTSQLVPFRPESIVSYEAGLKSELFNRRLRLNIAAYRNNFKDLAAAVPVVTASPGVFGSRIVNIGKIDYTGLEFDARAILNDYLSIDGNAGYVDIKYKEFMIPTSGAAGAPIVNIASIANAGYTSKYTANIAFNARTPVGTTGMVLNARLGYTYESPKRSFSTSISTPFNEQLISDAKKQIDAQISLDNIRLGGAEAQLMLWGKNLTNRHEFVRAVDFGSLGYAGGFYADPRTYGLSLNVKF